MTASEKAPLDFIRQIVANDLAQGTHQGRVHTRFPPEPNGYLHIGHAKSICLNFGIAEGFGGLCNLRFDDTNPAKEEVEYVDAIRDDVRWLGFDWGDREYYASDYFEQFYEWAIHLIREGLAYVDDGSLDEIRAARGSLTEPGVPSPFRDRPVDQNLDLFRRMREGEFPEGSRVLRAKIDMAHQNLQMRDPVIYRIKYAHHHRTGDAWCIYPLYDFAHGLSDAIEGITHSLCTLEFENHRPLYDWFNEKCPVPSIPRQYEFARLNLEYAIMSKRKLLRLVQEKHVSGWDDPRMLTIRGMRRRGYTPESVRMFCDRVGIARSASRSEMALLEHCIREDLNRRAQRVMAVLDPVELVIENWPTGQVEMLDAVNNPEDSAAGTRQVPFAGRLWIERDDFMIDPPKKFFRLGPGREVRLRWAYFVTCVGYETDANGQVVRIRATYDPATRGGDAPDGRKVKGTLHWVSAAHAVEAEVRVYDRLFSVPDPDQGDDFVAHLNPDSLRVISAAQLEPSLASAQVGTNYQFERLGYFCLDSGDSRPDALVFNRTVGLKDTWAKAMLKD